MGPLHSLTLCIICITAQASCLNLQIDKLHVTSFVPNEICVNTSIEQLEAINFNLTINVPFPGKLLMHIFVRKLSNTPGGSDIIELVRLKNRDLCKMLDSLRNVTTEHGEGESLLPSTFLISCPLVPGFYYVASRAIDVKLFPFRVPDGRYLAMLELVQVYEEVIKLVTCRIKFSMKTPTGYVAEESVRSSNEEERQTEESPKEEPSKEEGSEEEPPKEELPKEEPPKKELPKEELSKEEPPKKDPPKDEPPKEEPPKEGPPKEELSKEEPPKEEPPKEESSKEDTEPEQTTDDSDSILNDYE